MDEQSQADDRHLLQLWREVAPHPVQETDVGQYVVLRRRQSLAAAGAEFPEVAQHLADGCRSCEALVSEIDVLVAEAVMAEQPAAASAGWHQALWQAVYVAHPQVADRAGSATAPAPTVSDDAPDIDHVAPSVDTLTLTVHVEGWPVLSLDLTPHGDGVAVRLRREGVGDAPADVTEAGLAGWRIRVTPQDAADDASEALTNDRGAALLHGLAWDGLWLRSVGVDPPTAS